MVDLLALPGDEFGDRAVLRRGLQELDLRIIQGQKGRPDLLLRNLLHPGAANPERPLPKCQGILDAVHGYPYVIDHRRLYRVTFLDRFLLC